MKKLVVPPAAKLVELSLTVDGENYNNYRAMLQGASGEEVLSLNRLNVTRKRWDRRGCDACSRWTFGSGRLHC